MEKNDVELINDILSGDESAFTTLVDKYQKSVHALAWRKIGDFHIAEEITQDTFLRVYQKLPTLKDPKQFAGWLYVIANRRCIAWHRKRKLPMESLETTSEDVLEQSAYTCYVSEQQEEASAERCREIVEELLERLPENERTVMVLHYLGEMSCEAISKFLGVSPNTVKSRLSRARKRLREAVPLIRDVLGGVQLPANLTERIVRESTAVKQPAPTGGKPLLPLATLGASIILAILLIGASQQHRIRFQLPYSFAAQSEPTIDIVEVPLVLDIHAKPDLQNRAGRDDVPGKTRSDGLQKGKTSMQNNFTQDSTRWKLPEGAKARLGKGYVFNMAYSPDGTLLAAAGTIGIWIYDARTGEELHLLKEHTEGVGALAFSPDNQLLACEGKDETILLWDPRTGQLEKTLTGHAEVSSIAFSPDGKRLASGGEDETIRIWDLNTGELLLTYAGHADRVSKVIYSPDGEMLASYGRDELIHLWDAHTGEFLRTLTGYTGRVSAITFSPDAKLLASGGGDGKIRLWEPRTGALQATFAATTNSEGVDKVVFSPDGQTLASTHWGDDVIQFWDVSTGERLKTIESPPDTAHHIVFSPDGDTLVNAHGDGTIRFWDVDSKAPLRTLTGYAQMFMCMAYSPDGTKVVAVSSCPSLRIWDTRTGELIKTYYPDSKMIHSIAYSPDGVTLACGSGDTVWLLNTETGERGRIFTGHKKDCAESVAFSPDGQTLASGDSNGRIHLWDVPTGKTLKILEWHDDYVRSLAFSPDGQRLVSTSDSEVRFWDITTGDTLKTLSDSVVALSPDWQTFVSTGIDGEIKLWEFDVDEPLKTITSEMKLYSLAYSPNGQTFAGIGSDKKLSFWDAAIGEVIQTFDHEHIQGAWFMLFSPDGRTLATAGWNSTVMLWDVPQ